MKPKKPERDAYLTIRIPKRKREAYAQAAEAEKRSLTNWIEWNLDQVIKREVEPK